MAGEPPCTSRLHEAERLLLVFVVNDVFRLSEDEDDAPPFNGVVCRWLALSGKAVRLHIWRKLLLINNLFFPKMVERPWSYHSRTCESSVSQRVACNPEVGHEAALIGSRLCGHVSLFSFSVEILVGFFFISVKTNTQSSEGRAS